MTTKAKKILEITLDPINEKEVGFSVADYTKGLEGRLKRKYALTVLKGTAGDAHQCGVASIKYPDLDERGRDAVHDAIELVWQGLRSEKGKAKTRPRILSLYSWPAWIFILAELLVVGVLFALIHFGFNVVNPYFLSGFGGVAGAWLHMLDLLCNHKTLSVSALGKADAGWNELGYLAARTILGASAGLVSYGVFGGADWFSIVAGAASHAADSTNAGSPSAGPFFHVFCLGILAGFSTTTLASLSKASEKRSERLLGDKHPRHATAGDEASTENEGAANPRTP